MTSQAHRFTGKVAVVTGVTQGIGNAIVRRLIDEGAKVVGGARREKELLAMEAELGQSFVGVPMDVTREADVERLVGTAVARFGQIDAAFNNVGGGRGGTIVDLTEDKFQATLDLSLKGVFFSTKHAARQMIKQGGGAIVNISSLNSLVPMYGGGSYSMSKAAVDMLSKNAALELARHRIRVNALLPGLVETPASVPFRNNPQLAAKFMERIAFGRPAKVEEMAGPALFLASDDASYISGAVLVADGGWAITGYPDLSPWYSNVS